MKTRVSVQTPTCLPRTFRATGHGPARPLAVVFDWAASAWRRHRNRRAVASLLALDDTMLRDIGLARGDVAGALVLPMAQDPSVYLACQVAERRRQRRLARLCGEAPRASQAGSR